MEYLINEYDDRRKLVSILADNGYFVTVEIRDGKNYRQKDYFVVVNTSF